LWPLLWRIDWVVLEVDEVGGRVVGQLFLLVGEGDLLVFEELSLLLLLVLGQ
jgi:hypothetical protein